MTKSTKAKNLKAWRQSNSWTQVQAAALFGVSRRTYQNWEGSGYPEKQDEQIQHLRAAANMAIGFGGCPFGAFKISKPKSRFDK